MQLNKSPGFSKVLWYSRSTDIMVQASAIFQPLWNYVSIRQKLKIWYIRIWKKILPFPRMRGLPWILFQEQDWVHGWVLLIPCTVFIAFIVARIVDGQWINITACKAGVKYDFIYRNLSEIKDTASSPMRLLVGNPIDKGHKKQLATLHLKRNSASKWAKQVKTPLLRTADLI